MFTRIIHKAFWKRIFDATLFVFRQKLRITGFCLNKYHTILTMPAKIKIENSPFNTRAAMTRENRPRFMIINFNLRQKTSTKCNSKEFNVVHATFPPFLFKCVRNSNRERSETLRNWFVFLVFTRGGKGVLPAPLAR